MMWQRNKKRSIWYSPLIQFSTLGYFLFGSLPSVMAEFREREGLGGAMDQDVMKVSDEIGKITTRILEEYVSRCQPLWKEDVDAIREEIKKIYPYQARLDKPPKANLFLIQAYLAHYGGDSQEALKMAEKAWQVYPENPDVTDTLITLSLCHENYSKAKSTLKTRQAGQNVALGAFTTQTKKDMAADVGANPYAATPATRHSPQSGKWTIEPPSAAGGTPAMGTPPSSSDPMLSRGRREREGLGMASQQPGILNLATAYMPADNLGDDFSSLKLRTINGSYFYYESGKGQLLCALLWVLPEEGQSAESSPGFPGERRRSRSSPDRIREREGREGMRGIETPNPIPPAALDLPGDANDLRDLFQQHILHGRMQFLTVNQDALNQYTWARIIKYISEDPWPWANCMAYDPANAIQWPLKERYSPVMVLVDTKGKIRYMGPVGGYLPRMLIDLELPNAMPMQAFAPEAPKSETPVEQAAPAAETSPATAAEPATETPAEPGKTSEPQAVPKLKLAHIQLKISPVSALTQCDEVLKQYPDSLEADEAKKMIQSILRDNENLKKQRKEQGKYIGEE